MGIDIERQRFGQPERRDTTDHHPAEVACLLGTRKRCLAYPEQVADGVVDVEAARRENHAPARHRWILARGNDDHVRGLLRREPVATAERCGIGELRIAFDDLVLDSERAETLANASLDRRAVVSEHRVRSADP